MFQVVKRDGEIAEFQMAKITSAIDKAFDAKEKNYSKDMIDLLALRVTADFQNKIQDGKVTVEDIQDSVENVLIQAGYSDVAKAYILYRKQREKIRNMKSTILDYKEIVDSYVKVEDWRVKENSTVTYSVGGLILSNSGAVTANYWLSEIYDNEIADAHRNADIHIHDLSMLTGYCAGWSLKQLIKEGLGGIEGKITSAPAKHLSVLCNQMVNFLGIMQNEWAGAQAFSSFDTYLAPFVKVDNLSYPEVKKCIESFIYGVNTPSRWGTQAPFSNITLDWTVPDDLAELPAIVGGKDMDFKYKDCKKEMDMVNKAFIETMIEGDANGRGFQYPIPTYSITKEFDWSDTENNRLLFEMTSKYGTPYFSNYINSDMKPSDIRSMCCRLRLDLRELRKKSGGFFGSGESTGSVGVVTINMPRIAYQSKTPEEFYRRLDRLMDISARSLHIKREVITKLLNEGLYPYTKRYLGSFDNHFSTIGLVGMNEAGLNACWLKKDMTDPETQKFTKEVLEHMRSRLSDYQEQYPGELFNLEATPAESTAYRLAKHDRSRYPDIKTAGKEGDTPYYTNSSHLPVDYKWGVYQKNTPENLEPYLKSSNIKAVIITSPTYEGFVSDISAIKSICQKYGAYLITDEAHGALYPFSNELPQSAVKISDFTIQSLHKTAGGLNPTALLHSNCNIDPSKALALINTTSPSYPLLATIEANINYLNSQKGRKKLENLISAIKTLKARFPNLEFGGHDMTKLLIKSKTLSGEELSQKLYEYGIEDERANEKSVMLLCGIGTDEKKLERLKKVLRKL